MDTSSLRRPHGSAIRTFFFSAALAALGACGGSIFTAADAGSPCSADSQCAPPQLICIQGACADGCPIAGCPAGSCDAATGRCGSGGGSGGSAGSGGGSGGGSAGSGGGSGGGSAGSGGGSGGGDSACTSDANCGANTRCCVNDGLCHPTVGDGAGCDCAHPCAAPEACSPGFCGAGASVCRPACNPGDASTVASNCAAIGGGPAFCEAISPDAPADGGTCLPAGSCSITAQDCPDAPLDLAAGAGGPPGNPLVHYTCVPAGFSGSAQVNACVPAGALAVGAAGCDGGDEVCGDNSTACVQGAECVGIEGSTAAYTCALQCPTPQAVSFTCPASGAGGCPAGYFCDQLLGNGEQLFTTGVCTALTSLGLGCGG